MSVAWIPPGDYREGVEKIIYHTDGQSEDFKELLSKSSLEDLEEALKIPEKSDNTVTRRARIKTELRIRKRPIGIKSNSAWYKWFEQEWNGIRRAAARLQEVFYERQTHNIRCRL